MTAWNWPLPVAVTSVPVTALANAGRAVLMGHSRSASWRCGRRPFFAGVIGERDGVGDGRVRADGGGQREVVGDDDPVRAVGNLRGGAGVVAAVQAAEAGGDVEVVHQFDGERAGAGIPRDKVIRSQREQRPGPARWTSQVHVGGEGSGIGRTGVHIAGHDGVAEASRRTASERPVFCTATAKRTLSPASGSVPVRRSSAAMAAAWAAVVKLPAVKARALPGAPKVMPLTVLPPVLVLPTTAFEEVHGGLIDDDLDDLLLVGGWRSILFAALAFIGQIESIGEGVGADGHRERMSTKAPAALAGCHACRR